MEYYTITCPYAETFVLHYDTLMSFGMSYDTYDEERQVTKPTSPLQSCLYVPDFDTLVPAPELSLAEAKKIIPLET